MNGHFLCFKARMTIEYSIGISMQSQHPISHLNVYVEVADFPGISIGGENLSVSTGHSKRRFSRAVTPNLDNVLSLFPNSRSWQPMAASYRCYLHLQAFIFPRI